jgi:hypothetical protein
VAEGVADGFLSVLDRLGGVAAIAKA